jgi:hypothetical protein
MASFCLLDHQAYYSVWDRRLCQAGDADKEAPWRSIFCFWTGIVFLTGQVIFVPEWPKREFVSL